MKSSILLAAAEEGGHHIVNELWAPAPVIGGVMFAGLMLMLFFTLAFNGISNRH